MTVKQLIEKLSYMPQDIEVIIRNDDSYLSGVYKVTDAIRWDKNEAEIVTDYEWRRSDDTDGWSNGKE